MVKPAYYNEIDPFAAQWLRNLIAAGHIAPGDVDERSIEDVKPIDLKGYTQCHFFAGIGVWSYALRRSGWQDDRPVWTGSCPCQPFSTAGKGDGFADERHLWPAWHYLIQECGPAVVFGEQVASKDGLAWLDLVQADMEGSGYAFQAVDTCSAGFGAPHIRQRLYFVGDSDKVRCESTTGVQLQGQRQSDLESLRHSGLVGDSHRSGLEGHRRGHQDAGRQRSPAIRSVAASGQPDSLEHAHDPSAANEVQAGRGMHGVPGNAVWTGPVNGFWRDADWLYCRDGGWRPVEPGTFPLVNGAPERVGRLHGYGNAVNAEAAAGFVRSFLECGHYDW